MTFERDGRTWMRGVVRAAAIEALATAFDGERRLHHCDLDRDALAAITSAAATVLPGARAVRVVAFDKSAEENWTLGWHQDRAVALAEKADVTGFGNWSRKQGVWHAEPPIETLERMIFARVHLDATNQENGCLQLAIGSHARGKVSAADAQRAAEEHPIEFCVGEPGDVLFVKALTLHRSGPSRSASRRRTLRIDFCAEALPAPLEWARAA